MHGLQQCKVLFPAVVAVAGNVTGLAPVGAARCVGKDIPDAQSLAALCGTAFDLIGRRCSTPDKFFWKFSHEGSPLCGSDSCTQALEVCAGYGVGPGASGQEQTLPLADEQAFAGGGLGQGALAFQHQ